MSRRKEWDDAPKAFPKVKHLKERGGRQYFMSPEDEKALFAAVLTLDKARPGPRWHSPRKRDAFRYHLLLQALGSPACAWTRPWGCNGWSWHAQGQHGRDD